MVMEQFDSMLSSVIDSTLGQRCSIIGYQFSEIVRSLMSVYFCGGSCVEDVTSHLMRHLSYHPTLRTCSSDTILRAIRELTQDNISYTSDQGKTYDFNTADKLNILLVNALISTGDLKEMEEYDVDFDHQFIETEKYDAKPTYKKFLEDNCGFEVFLLSYLCLGLAAQAEVTDVTPYDNVLYAESVTGTAGSMVTLSLKLNNTEEVTGYQVDLVLPANVTVATDEDGFYLTELSTARTTSKKMDYLAMTGKHSRKLS